MCAYVSVHTCVPCTVPQLTPVDAVAPAMPLAALADLLHVCAVVRCEIHECVVGEAELIQCIKDLPCGVGGVWAVRGDGVTPKAPPPWPHLLTNTPVHLFHTVPVGTMLAPPCKLRASEVCCVHM